MQYLHLEFCIPRLTYMSKYEYISCLAAGTIMVFPFLVGLNRISVSQAWFQDSAGGGMSAACDLVLEKRF